MWTVPWILVSIGIGLFIGAIAVDLFRRFYENHITRFEKVYHEDQNYFSIMSELDVKRWLLLETYNR